MSNLNQNENTPIIFYSFWHPQIHADIIDKMKKAFKESGHNREIEFRYAFSFTNIPPNDGDIYLYDALLLNAFHENKLIRPIPDIINTDEIVEWSLNTTKINKKIYGIPVLLCSDSIICKKEDKKDKITWDDLKNNTGGFLNGVIMFYYLKASAYFKDKSVIKGDPLKIRKKPFEALKKYVAAIGGKEELLKPEQERNKEIIANFSQEKYKYFIAFSEFIGILSGKDYTVMPFMFDDNCNEPLKLMYSDLISIGKNVSEEKLLDCIDLIELYISKDFQYDIAKYFGFGFFTMPANINTMKMFENEFPEYKDISKIFLDPENSTVRFSKNHFDNCKELEKHLVELLLKEEY